MFKKTIKTSATGSFDLSRQTETRSLELQTAQKETQLYSLWKDSALYQYAVVKEQVDKANSESLKEQETQNAKQEQIVKESQPDELWVYALMVLGTIVFVMISRRFS